MRPVDQTTFGVPGGNCFSACVATLLELPIEQVPYFMGDFREIDSGAWFDRFSTWLKPYGLWPVCFTLGSDPTWKPLGLCIMGGQSPRGPHSVVARGLEVVHDPHPSRAGLLKIEDAILLVPFDPSERGAHG